jgi:mannose/cellobiose epimerase-like protein (N-acyl-D-glucosamine 2-epimerase family)
MLHLYEALVNLGLAAQSIFCCAGRDRVFARLLPVFDDCYRLITRRIFNKRLNVTLEDFDDDMTISMDQRYGSVTNAHALEWMGFMIEARWLTGRRHPFLEKAGRGLLDASFARADSPLGAFRNDYYLREGRSAEWTSFWAQVESTLTACFAAKFYGSPRYLRKADRLWSFYSRYFLDREFGGIFSEVSSSGIALDRRKGHMYKCDHHNLRMCEKIIQYRLLDA